jgi:hypothetical protein
MIPKTVPLLTGRMIQDPHYDWMTDLICSFDSRNRKKEHVEALERGIKRCVERNHELEDENKTL